MDLNITSASNYYLTSFDNDYITTTTASSLIPTTTSKATSPYYNIFLETSAKFSTLKNITTKSKKMNDNWDYESIDFIPDVIWESLLSMLLFLILLVLLCFICWKTQILQGKYMGYTITRSDAENL
jgi:hypothetical protein